MKSQLMFLKRHILQYLFSSKAVRLLEYTYYYIEKEYHNIGKRPRDEELSKSFCLFEEVKLLLYNFTSCHVVKCFGFMIITERRGWSFTGGSKGSWSHPRNV